MDVLGIFSSSENMSWILEEITKWAKLLAAWRFLIILNESLWSMLQGENTGTRIKYLKKILKYFVIFNTHNVY